MHARNWIGLGFYLFFVTTGVAGPLEDGNAALAKGDYDTAFRVFSPLAEEGNPTAQSALAFMYAFGRGVAADPVAGVKWYRRSAEQGDAEAQCGLGAMLSQGLGVARDAATAVYWFRRSAEQGYVLAQSNLAASYFLGDGVARDYFTAYVWFALAVSQFQPGKKKDDTTRNRDLAAKQLTPKQLADAKRMVEDWKPKPER
jgi:TPR repeat protein